MGQIVIPGVEQCGDEVVFAQGSVLCGLLNTCCAHWRSHSKPQHYLCRRLCCWMASWDEALGKVRELVTYLRESSDSLSWQKEKESWGQGAPDFIVRAPGKAGELVTRSVCHLAEQWGKNALSSKVGGRWGTCSSPLLRCQVPGLWHRKAQSL